jgi:hypothetical protein
MTIEEFMRDIAPKMRSGFVFYDWMGDWQFCTECPEENLPIVCKIGFITLPQLTSLKSGIYGR